MSTHSPVIKTSISGKRKYQIGCGTTTCPAATQDIMIAHDWAKGFLKHLRRQPTRTVLHVRGEKLSTGSVDAYQTADARQVSALGRKPSGGVYSVPEANAALGSSCVEWSARTWVLRSGPRNRPRRLSGFRRPVSLRPSWRLYSPQHAYSSPL